MHLYRAFQMHHKKIRTSLDTKPLFCSGMYSICLLLLIMVINPHCFSAALIVSAGSYFTLPNHEPLQRRVTMATTAFLCALSFPVGNGPPAVTCRKIPPPYPLPHIIHTHRHAHTCTRTHRLTYKETCRCKNTCMLAV